MPTYADFSLARYEDGLLTISMAPPVAVGGWSVQFKVQKRFGGMSGLILKNAASGFCSGFVSGINILNSGEGIFQIQINHTDTSGLDYGNYSYGFTRTDSGSNDVLSAGYLLLNQSIG